MAEYPQPVENYMLNQTEPKLTVHKWWTQEGAANYHNAVKTLVLRLGFDSLVYCDASCYCGEIINLTSLYVFFNDIPWCLLTKVQTIYCLW